MLINYLPPVLQDIREFQLVMSDTDSENQSLYNAIADLENNQYITTVTEDQINRYEKMLSIVPKDTDTLLDRRFKVLALYNKKLPYTRISLENDLNTLCGENGYQVSIDYDKHKLTVRVALTVKEMFRTVSDYLDTVVPLNMIIDLMLLCNTWEKVSKFTWKQASAYTWQQLREDVL
jgi:Uncharacterized protein conserved in bacteria (DUF2313).